MDDLWKHCLESAAFAQTIARWELKSEKMAELAFTAGMLHDIGKLLLTGNLPDDHRRAIEQSRAMRVTLDEAEQGVFGVSHAEVGGVIMGQWGLPIELVRAVGWHHSPHLAGDTSFSILTAVHAANVLAHPASSDQNGAAPVTGFHLPYLRKLGFEYRRNPWRQLCGFKPTLSEESPDALAAERASARH
jgi:putative nucleotidyltransferase with HDIG domain